MRIRTVYFKVADMTRAVTFWKNLLGQPPSRTSEKWTEFLVGEVRLGLLLNDFGDELVGSACVPVFEFDAAALQDFLARAKALGATVVLDGISDETTNTIVMASPDGHEFELCTCHE